MSKSIIRLLDNFVEKLLLGTRFLLEFSAYLFYGRSDFVIKDEKVRTSQKEIAGTTYIVESAECVEAKETPYSKLKRLISRNAMELERSKESLEKLREINSTYRC